jgi:hypothetical protein
VFIINTLELMLQVKTKKNDNPFYGMRNCLNLFQNAGKGTISTTLLDACWNEVKNSKEGKEMLFSMLFSIGDITARKHNIFGAAKPDSGGNAARDNFRIIMNWMKKTSSKQFVKFMNARLFNEFTSFDNLLAMRVKTIAKSKRVIGIIDQVAGNDDIAKYIAHIIQHGNPFDKFLVSKFLSRPRLSKRSKHKVLLPETKMMMKAKEEFIKKICDIVDFAYEKRNGYIHFTDFYNWKKEYNGELESVLFSSGKIKEFDQQEFLAWLDKLPSSARFRVRCRVLKADNTVKEKWGPIGTWFLGWEKFKEIKQTEQRVIEEKVRQGTATEKEVVKLEQVKKEAKVTVGAVNFTQLFKEILTNTADLLKIQPFLDKVNLPYNTLVFVDDSGSMQSSWSWETSHGYTPFDMAAFIATICIMKNPDDTGRSLMGLFSTGTRMHTCIDSVRIAPNSFMKGSVKNLTAPFYSPQLNFKENLENMRGFLKSHQTGSGTNIASIPDAIHAWTKGDSALIEQLQNFPVWTIITDGNFNQMSNATASIGDFMRKCEQYFGFRPFIVAIDVANNSSQMAENFSGVDNFMFLPPNPAQIEQFLTNFTDIDVMDVYTPLQSIHRSNRYELVRANVL